MRDYIILNGVNSNTITGLLISKLPPITKPKQRTQTEEIDGRDGDIVTPLGYSAYEKEIEIGLYGDFDIDEVIAYFNSEGTVTFSNEPDKYYNYKILDQIDFDKLIRFKTAKVKMHVQPFKYPLEETPVEITIQTTTNEAEEMDLDNTADAPMQIALKGNTSQEGTPTPDNPIDIQVVSGDNTINIYYNHVSTSVSNWEQGAISSNVNKTYSQCKTDNATRIRTIDLIELDTNKNYTISCETGYEVVIQAFNNDELLYQIQGTTNVWVSSKTFTNIPYIAIAIRKSDNSNITPSEIGNAKVKLISTDQSATYPISLGNIELCKIGDYQDRIYKDSGKWYLNKQIGKVVLDGSEDYNYNDYTTYAKFSSNQIINNSYATGVCLSSHFKYGTGQIGTVKVYNNNWLDIFTNPMTLQEWKTWLSNNNVSVYYACTPTYTEITDSTLISQLNAIEQAKSYDTNTHIRQNANKKPFILNATTVQKGTDTATVDNEGNIYSKPTLDIEGNGNVEVYLAGNQIFNIDLSNSSECIIDTTNLEAYDPSTNALMNRQVTGDYSNFILNTGENTVKVSGNVTKATISNYTRWL